MNYGLRVMGSTRHRAAAGIQLVTNAFASKATAAGNSVTTSAIDTTGANLLVLGVTYLFSDASTPTDNKSNMWHKLTAYSQGGTSFTTIWYAYNANVGAGHTFTAPSAGNYPCISVAAFSGANATAAVFEAGTDSGLGKSVSSGGTCQPGAVAAASAGDLYVSIAGGYVDATLSIDTGSSGFILLAQDGSGGQDIYGGIAYLLATNTSPVNPTWTATGSPANLCTAIAAFAKA